VTKLQFVERMKKAVQIAKQKGAILNTEAVIAQAALESGWGNSLLAAIHNNLFGIKAFRDAKGNLVGWSGPTVKYWTFEQDRVTKKYVPVLAEWRVYPSWNECLVNYSEIIKTRWWFQDALPHADPPHGDGNAKMWIYRLVDTDQPGELRWATSLDYVEKVIDRVAYEIARLEGTPRA
jgi:flagellum-specific peptidoglycan hydrolase FlgJ